MTNIQRNIKANILNGLQNSPCVYIAGQRQVGKSTLANMIAKEQGFEYLSLDDVNTYDAAFSDPVSFIASFDHPVILDEVQLAPPIFRIIKKKIDDNRLEDKKSANGKFLLTGSTNIFALPKLSDALVGRTLIYNLLPISMAEYHGSNFHFIDNLFNNDLKFKSYNESQDFQYFINKTTLPEIIDADSKTIKEYYNAYLNTIIQRDIKSMIDLENLTKIPNILQIIASRVGSIYTDNSVANDVKLTNVTYKRYKMILNSLFLVFDIPPWFRNIGKRLVKSSKTYISDSALHMTLLGNNFESINSIFKGAIFENFIANELNKLIALSVEYKLFHFRTSDNKEIDFIIEDSAGKIIAIEAKASKTISIDDFKNIKLLQTLEPNFQKGIVIYQGDKVLSFGKNLYAVPFHAMVG